MISRDDTEILAARVHQIWARWFLHYSQNATPQNMQRWAKLAHTSYEQLPESEKEKDREILRALLGTNKQPLK